MLLLTSAIDVLALSVKINNSELLARPHATYCQVSVKIAFPEYQLGFQCYYPFDIDA